MQYRIVIPDHTKAGQSVRVNFPDGSDSIVQVPKGMKPGDLYVLDGDSVNTGTATQHAKDRKRKPNNNKNEELAVCEAVAVDLEASKPQGFLNREISSCQDFVLALSVGLIIGLGIVMGFFFGVLFSTRNIHVAPSLQPHTPPGMLQPRRPNHGNQINEQQVRVNQMRQDDGKYKTTININVNKD